MTIYINEVKIQGNLGQNPEITFTSDGKPVAKLNIATSMVWKDIETNEKKDRTEWHRVTLFGKLSEIAKKYLKKGSHVFVEGRLQTSKYEKNGEARYSTEIIADELKF